MTPGKLAALIDVLVPGGKLPNGVIAPAASTTPALSRAASLLAEPPMADLAAALIALPAVDETALRTIEASSRAAFSRLVAGVLAAYYDDASVLSAFGWYAAPPHPDGHQLEGFDEALLAPIRRRAPFWRG